MRHLSVKGNIVWNMIFKYTQILLQIIFTSLLSRILTPHDFGIFAIVNVFTTLFSLLGDMGFGAAIIQDNELSQEDIDHIFSATVYLAFFLAILFSLFSIILKNFYNLNDLFFLGVLLSVSLYFNCINMIPNAILRKNLYFAQIGIRTIVATIISNGIAIILAQKGFSYYSLVLQSIVSSVIIFFWNCRRVSIRFIWRSQFGRLKKVMGFSSYQFLFSIINYLARNLDNILTGKYMGPVALGYYDKAYRLMLYPLQAFTFVISPLMHPLLAKYQKTPEIIYEKYLKVVKVLSLVGGFISIYCFFASKELIFIIFGKQWESAIPCFKWMSISVWAQLVSSSAGAIYQSLGNTKLMFRSGKYHISLSIIVIIMGVWSRNLILLSKLVSIGFIIKFFIEYWFLIKKGFGYSFHKFLFHFIPDFFIVLFTVCGMLFFNDFNNSSSLIMAAIIKGIVCLVFYVFGLIVLGQTKHLKEVW